MESTENTSTNIYQVLGTVKPYFKKLRWWIPVCLALGLALGAFLYFKKAQETVKYYGKTTFMLSSDDVSSGNSGLAALGVMLPGSDGGGNKTILLELLKSNRMMEKTLLTKALISGDSDLLINHFIELHGYRNLWKGDKKWESYKFPEKFIYNKDEERDGFLRQAALAMSVNYTPNKTDEGIFEISFIHFNQEFAKAFLDNLIVTIIEYYTEKKTAKARVVYEYAKNRHDELYGRINGQQRNLARMQDQSSEFVFVEDKVPQVTVSRDIEATTALLQEAAKSLAAARMSLVQETPFIQVIDDVRLPLAKIEANKEKFAAIGFAAGFLIPLILIVGIIVGKDFLKKQKEEFHKTAHVKV